MKKTSVIAVSTLAGALVLASSVFGHGGHGGNDGGFSGFSWCVPPALVNWVERTVTAYRFEPRQQVVPVTVQRCVSRPVEETYRYTELVPETTPRKEMLTSYTCVARE